MWEIFQSRRDPCFALNIYLFTSGTFSHDKQTIHKLKITTEYGDSLSKAKSRNKPREYLNCNQNHHLQVV